MRLDLNKSAFQKAVGGGVRSGVYRAAAYLAGQVKRELSVSGNAKSKGRKTYTGSKENGKPPRLHTANLRNSILAEKVGEGLALVGPRTMAPYGKYLEFGFKTKGRGTFVHRPFMSYSLDKYKAKIVSFFAGCVK